MIRKSGKRSGQAGLNFHVWLEYLEREVEVSDGCLMLIPEKKIMKWKSKG